MNFKVAAALAAVLQLAFLGAAFWAAQTPGTTWSFNQLAVPVAAGVTGLLTAFLAFVSSDHAVRLKAELDKAHARFASDLAEAQHRRAELRTEQDSALKRLHATILAVDPVFRTLQQGTLDPAQWQTASAALQTAAASSLDGVPPDYAQTWRRFHQNAHDFVALLQQQVGAKSQAEQQAAILKAWNHDSRGAEIIADLTTLGILYRTHFTPPKPS